MTVSWTREQRLTARRDGLPLIALAVDWGETDGGGLGKTVLSGPADEAIALAVEEVMRKAALHLQTEVPPC